MDRSPFTWNLNVKCETMIGLAEIERHLGERSGNIGMLCRSGERARVERRRKDESRERGRSSLSRAQCDTFPGRWHRNGRIMEFYDYWTADDCHDDCDAG